MKWLNSMKAGTRSIVPSAVSLTPVSKPSFHTGSIRTMSLESLSSLGSKLMFPRSRWSHSCGNVFTNWNGAWEEGEVQVDFWEHSDSGSSTCLGSSELKKISLVWGRGKKRAWTLESDTQVSRLFFAFSWPTRKGAPRHWACFLTC